MHRLIAALLIACTLAGCARMPLADDEEAWSQHILPVAAPGGAAGPSAS